jgi:hypothetical protein
MGSDLYASYRKPALMRLFDQTKASRDAQAGLRSTIDQESNELSLPAATMTVTPGQIQESITTGRRVRHGPLHDVFGNIHQE